MAFIVGAKRTPIAAFMGGLRDISAPHLGSIAAKAVLASCRIDPSEVQELIFGAVLTAGMGQAPDRQVALGAGMAESTVSTLVNKGCASGLKAIILGSQSIQLGHKSIVVAGGMESMSKSPHYLYLREPNFYGHLTNVDSIQLDGLTDVSNNLLLGSCTEKVCSELGISREAQDEYAVLSYTRARAAQEQLLFEPEIVEVIKQTLKGETRVKFDEECQRYFPDKFASLLPAFAKNGTITAANSSKINDGACAFALMSEQTVRKRGLKPLARIVAYEEAGVQPIDFAIAPALSAQKCLRKAGLSMGEIDYHEINETSSAVALANMKLLDLDPSVVNLHGGAVSLGHPLGMTGARLIMSLISVLKVKNGKLGMASVGHGGGGSSSIIIERIY